MKLEALVGFLVAGGLGLASSAGCGDAGGSGSAEKVGTTRSALSTAQCEYFETNGSTTICHATGSAKNPYVLLKVSESGCVSAHANHPLDFIDVDGGNCKGAACLPETAPCDPTLPCCGNLSCTGGTCQCPSGQTFCESGATCVDATSDPNNCGGCGVVCAAGTTCANGACVSPCVALDQCHVAGTPDSTGTCSNPVAPNGTACGSAGSGGAAAAAPPGGGGAGGAPAGAPAGGGGAAGAPAPAAAAPPGQGFCLNGVCSNCPPADQCHAAGSFDPTTGGCSNPSQPDGTGCDDGNACTQTDTCQAGACSGSNAVGCTAADQCHVAGACDPRTGTCSSPIAADGTVCSAGACETGVCTNLCASVTCAAGECQVASCSPSTGACAVQSKPDGTSCSTGTCTGGICRASPESPCSSAVTDVQTFSASMAGCGGAVSFAARGNLCGANCHVCSSAEWVAQSNSTVPARHYWTNDMLGYLPGGVSGNCAVSATGGSQCPAGQSMLVCTTASTDSFGNRCNLVECGLDSPSPNRFFGGCGTTAGTLCCCP